ncbi:uncharacterized protein J3D65DRAFT_612051 [Phyllosticta citribraziliensis]|uniref:Uncharacterized protein n=1 Tax=Phyllosticta citribraziliensis TaxID=989973 RepID=A0ABR1M488_9PEZI
MRDDHLSIRRIIVIVATCCCYLHRCRIRSCSGPRFNLLTAPPTPRPSDCLFGEAEVRIRCRVLPVPSGRDRDRAADDDRARRSSTPTSLSNCPCLACRLQGAWGMGHGWEGHVTVGRGTGEAGQCRCLDGWKRRRPARSKQSTPKPFIVPSMVRRSDQPLATIAPLQQLEVNRSQRPNWALAEACPKPNPFFLFSFFFVHFPSPTLPLSHVFSRRHLARPLSSRRSSLRCSDLAFCGPPPSLHRSHDTALVAPAPSPSPSSPSASPAIHRTASSPTHANGKCPKMRRTPQAAEILHVHRPTPTPTPTHSNRP